MSKNAQRDQSDDIRGVARALTDPRVMEELLSGITSKAQRTLLEFFKFFHRKGLNINLKNGVKCKKDIHFLFGQRSWNNQAQKRFYDFPLENRILVAYFDLPTSNQIHNSRKKKKTKDTAKRDDVIRNRAELMYRALRKRVDQEEAAKAISEQHLDVFKASTAQAIAQSMYEQLYSLEDNSMEKIAATYQHMASKLSALEDAAQSDCPAFSSDDTEQGLFGNANETANPNVLFETEISSSSNDAIADVTTSAPFWSTGLTDDILGEEKTTTTTNGQDFITEENTYKLEHQFGAIDTDMDDHDSLFESTYGSTSPSNDSSSAFSSSPRPEMFNFDPFETFDHSIKDTEVFSLEQTESFANPIQFASYVPYGHNTNVRHAATCDNLFIESVFDGQMQMSIFASLL